MRGCLPLLAIFLTAIFVVGCSHSVSNHKGQLNERALQEIAKDTEDIRDLEHKGRVDVVGLNKKQVREYFSQTYSGDAPWLDIDTKVGHKLGILPASVHLRDYYQSSFTRNAAALYQRRQIDDNCPLQGERSEHCRAGRMLLFTEIYPRAIALPFGLLNAILGADLLSGLIVSHEYTHALQDEHVGLGALLPGSLYAHDEDTALARKSVIESEANLVSYAYFFDLDLEHNIERNLLLLYMQQTQTLTESLALLANRSAPSFYTRLLTAQYYEGLAFIRRNSNRFGSMHAIESTLQQIPPQSTEQLLWPEKIFGDRYDPPQHFSDAVLPGWEALASNVFGELQLRTLLMVTQKKTEAINAARGWDGDRYDVFEKEGRVLLSWRLVFDDEREAGEFLQHYQRHLKSKYPRRLRQRKGRLEDDGYTLYQTVPQRQNASDDEGVPTQMEEFIAIAQRGPFILIAEGLEPQRWRTDADALLAQMQTTTLPGKRTLLVAKTERPGRDIERAFFIDHKDIEMGLSWPLSDGPRKPFMRLGLRQNLELSLPLGASMRLSNPLGTTRVSLSLANFASPFDRSAGIAHLFHKGPTPRFWAVDLQHKSDLKLASFRTLSAQEVELKSSLGLFLSPLKGLLFHAGVEHSLLREGTSRAHSFVVGSVGERGFQRVPLLQWQLYELLYLVLHAHLRLTPSFKVHETQASAGFLIRL